MLPIARTLRISSPKVLRTDALYFEERLGCGCPVDGSVRRSELSTVGDGAPSDSSTKCRSRNSKARSRIESAAAPPTRGETDGHDWPSPSDELAHDRA